MKALLQRVSQASISFEGEEIARIGRGFAILLGVAQGDTEADAQYLARKIVNLRVFADDQDKFNLSVQDLHGELLVASQFTLLASTKKGHRPSFTSAAPPEEAEPLFDLFVELLRFSGLRVEKGIFRKHLVIEIHNDGPVTLLLDSKG
jgi:D-tyrosyl-tRNA(Tyr) deacylase